MLPLPGGWTLRITSPFIVRYVKLSIRLSRSSRSSDLILGQLFFGLRIPWFSFITTPFVAWICSYTSTSVELWSVTSLFTLCKMSFVNVFSGFWQTFMILVEWKFKLRKLFAISSCCCELVCVGDSIFDVLFESVLTYELPTDDAELLVRECVGTIANSCCN